MRVPEVTGRKHLISRTVGPIARSGTDRSFLTDVAVLRLMERWEPLVRPLTPEQR
jgi:hypothetical protein